jgi:hypothetical protein
MRRPRKSSVVYAAIVAGMILAPSAWSYFDSPAAAAAIAIACYFGCDLYSLVDTLEDKHDAPPKA